LLSVIAEDFKHAFMLSIIMLNITNKPFTLNVVMLNAVATSNLVCFVENFLIKKRVSLYKYFNSWDRLKIKMEKIYI
jgi:hypothetical protein